MSDNEPLDNQHIFLGKNCWKATNMMHSLRNFACFSTVLVLSLAMPVAAQVSTMDWTPTLERLFHGKAPQDLDELREMQQYNRILAQTVIDATVSVQIGAVIGSGVVVSPEGLVLTAAHVAGEPGRTVVIQRSDGRILQGTTRGIHRPFDAAMIQITDARDLPYLEMAHDAEVRPGQWCAAAGHPGGFSPDRGPVFRLGRVLDARPLIRTDCQLLGGDSGGPLVNLKGEVIGIHSRIGVSLTNNLHNPVSIYHDHWEGLVGGEIWTGSSYIGLRGDRRTDAALVTLVHEGSPAAKAGIREGDVILRFAGQRVQSFSDLVSVVQLRQPGEQVEVEIQREDQRLRVDLRVGRRESRSIKSQQPTSSRLADV